MKNKYVRTVQRGDSILIKCLQQAANNRPKDFIQMLSHFFWP
jgi:hypothetical protein